jgi:hypothetical protein
MICKANDVEINERSKSVLPSRLAFVNDKAKQNQTSVCKQALAFAWGLFPVEYSIEVLK